MVGPLSRSAEAPGPAVSPWILTTVAVALAVLDLAEALVLSAAEAPELVLTSPLVAALPIVSQVGVIVPFLVLLSSLTDRND